MKTNYRIMTAFVSFFVNGMMAVITANLAGYLVNDYGFSYRMVSSGLSIQAFGNVFMVALSGIVIKRLHRKNVLILFPVLFIAGCGVILLAKAGPLLFFTGMLLSGIGWGLCNNSIHLLVQEEGRGPAPMNLLHMSYAAGSFAGPFLLSILSVLHRNWQEAVILVMLLSAMIAVVFMCQGETFFERDPEQEPGQKVEQKPELVQKSEQEAEQEPKQKVEQKPVQEAELMQKSEQKPVQEPELVQKSKQILEQKLEMKLELEPELEKKLDPAKASVLPFLKQKRFLGCMGLYFCYVGAEGAVNAWLAEYLTISGIFSRAQAQQLLSVLWIMIILVRLCNTGIMRKISTQKMLICQGVGSVFFLMLIVMSWHWLVIVFAVVGFGVSFGGISPCNAINAGSYISGNGFGSGLLFAVGGIGSMILPLLIGTIAQDFTVKNGVSCIVVVLMIFTGIAVMNARWTDSHRQELT